MNSVPDPSISGSSDFQSGAEATASLDAGLKALEQGDYAGAIAHLEATNQESSDTTACLRARMGLVTAYERSRQTSKAIEICQELCHSTNPKVQDWAKHALTGFATHYPHLLSSSTSPTTSERDPADLAGNPVVNPQLPNQANTAPDVTGFVPFDSAAPSSTSPTTRQSRPHKDVTGFAPFNNPTASTPISTTAPAPAPDNRISPLSDRSIASPLPQETTLKQQPGKTTAPPSLEPPDSETTAAPSLPNVPISPTTLPQYQPVWKDAGRAVHWQPLRSLHSIRFWLIQAGTIAVFLWLTHGLLKFAMITTNQFIRKVYWIPGIRVIRLFYRDPFWFVLFSFVILLCLSPWLIDGLLKWVYGCKPLPMLTLRRQNSEAARIIQQFCRQNRLPLPRLRLLPVPIPIAFTYGNLPRTARITVSQGVFDQLAADEVATLYANELGHIRYRDFILLSWAVMMVQIPYLIYQYASHLGDYWQKRAEARVPASVSTTGKTLRTNRGKTQTQERKEKFNIPRRLQAIADFCIPEILALIAAIGYGFYWFFRWPALWLSRIRVYYSDRTSANLTGNPNGLTRALIKMAIGIAEDIQQQEHTRHLLESFDLLMPISYRQAIPLGSVYPHTPLELILEWDRRNPYRSWLTVNNSHPPAGDRLQLLAAYARHWKLETELDLDYVKSRRDKNVGFDRTLFLQGAPFFGPVFGVAAAMVAWGIGWMDNLQRGTWFFWMAGDWSLVYSFILVGISMGFFVRLNTFFPEIKRNNVQTDLDLPSLLMDPLTLPLDSQPVRMQGKLLGRRGISNWLSQDLVLQTSRGLIKLHYFSGLGPIGNLIHSFRPHTLIDQTVEVEGWFRRGATPWIDIERIRKQGSKSKNGGHPIWSACLAIAIALWATWIIIQG